MIFCSIVLIKILFKDENTNPKLDYVSNIEAVESVRILYDEKDIISLDSIDVNITKKDETISISNGKKIIEKIFNEKKNKNKAIKILEKNETKISKTTWKDILLLAGEDIGIEKVCEEDEFSVFATIKENSNLKSNEIVTDSGKYILGEYNIGELCDSTIKVLKRDKNIILIYNVDDENAKYSNGYIKANSGENIDIFLEGVERKINVSGLNGDLSGNLADIIMENKQITSVKLKRDKIKGKVLSLDNDGVEIEGFKKIPFSKNVRIFKDNDMEINGNIFDITVGNQDAEFIVGEKQICGVYIKSLVNTNIQYIRVLLKNTGFKDYYHDNITFKCNGDFSLKFIKPSSDEQNKSGTEITHEYVKDNVVTIDSNNEILKYSRIRIIPKDSNSKISISSINRGYGNPSYRGVIEIALMEGKIIIINELSMEEYLYSVVPSEMPSSYGVDALMVQAVCARSYAMCHLNNEKLSRFGAHVDDSTDFQVYNNTEETDNSIEAVNKTKGKVLKYDGNIVNAYFYATSCGSTTDGKIWGGDGIPYIQGKILSTSGENLDLLNNDVFTRFIKEDYKTFDSYSNWYRWNVTLSLDKISQGINNNIYSLYSSSPNNIKTFKDGEYKSVPIYSVGQVFDISISKRGSGGIVEEVVIQGSENIIKVNVQSNIRKLFNPYGAQIIKKDGTAVENFSSLPSAFFVIEKSGDNSGYTFYGGGYGHGAGMSQTAVKTMIEQGMKYEDILKFFYSGVEVE